MRAILVLGPLGLLLAACAAPVPYDQGVGFGDYNAYQAGREAQLTGAPGVLMTTRGPGGKSR